MAEMNAAAATANANAAQLGVWLMWQM